MLQGIVGNDQRHYVLDLLRTTPPDVNYASGKVICHIYNPPLPPKEKSFRVSLNDCVYLVSSNRCKDSNETDAVYNLR